VTRHTDSACRNQIRGGRGGRAPETEEVAEAEGIVGSGKWRWGRTERRFIVGGGDGDGVRI
jgi:hypothetical protein